MGVLKRFRRRRRGNAVLEAALVLPVLMSVAFGTVEYGHFFFVKHTLEGAAREGARAGIVAAAGNADVTTAVASVMSAAGFDGGQYTVTVTPSTVSSAAGGSMVSVTVSGAWGTVGVRPMGLIPGGKLVTGTAAMRRES
jgi:Flp pilus assembly protein TadG